MNRVLGAVDVFHEVHQATRIVKGAALNFVRCSGFGCAFTCRLRRLGDVADHFVDDLVLGHPLVGQVDGQPLAEERHLLQPAGDGFEVVFRGFENSGVGPEPHR